MGPTIAKKPKYLMNLINHIEKHLGPIVKGWGDKKAEHGIQVVQCHNQPFDGASTYTTVGLSNHTLILDNKKPMRQELVFSAWNKFDSDHIASFLLSFSEFMLSKQRGLLRGEYVGPSSPLIPSASVNSIYASVPVIYDDDFGELDFKDSKMVFVWLLPILATEVAYIKKHGWSLFEDLLESEDPDLWDLNRLAVI